MWKPRLARVLVASAALALVLPAPGTARSGPIGEHPVPTMAAVVVSNLTGPLRTSEPWQLPFPGGGRILFTRGTPGSSSEGFGVVESNGTIFTLSTTTADAYFDPLRPGGILVKPVEAKHPSIRSLRVVDGGWKRTRPWREGPDYYSRVSPDGRLIAYHVFVTHGRDRRETKILRVADRRGVVWQAPFRSLPGSVSWTPDGAVIAASARGMVAWDFRTGSVRPFLDRGQIDSLVTWGTEVDADASQVSWSHDGRYFSIPVSWEGDGKYRYGVAVATASGKLLSLLHVGAGVWSPAAPEIAYVASGIRHDRYRLYVYNALTHRRTLTRDDVPREEWVAWSPKGKWMLLSDWRANRWLFVSRDGRTIPYPWLGSSPRWAAPGVEVTMPVC
jgi:hypothetical protein